MEREFVCFGLCRKVLLERELIKDYETADMWRHFVKGPSN